MSDTKAYLIIMLILSSSVLFGIFSMMYYFKIVADAFAVANGVR